MAKLGLLKLAMELFNKSTILGLIKLTCLLIKTPLKVYLGLAGIGAQSRKAMLHMSMRLFYAPWARPANQSIVHLISPNKVRRLLKGAVF